MGILSRGHEVTRFTHWGCAVAPWVAGTFWGHSLALRGLSTVRMYRIMWVACEQTAGDVDDRNRQIYGMLKRVCIFMIGNMFC